jgi:hypothetical protein
VNENTKCGASIAEEPDIENKSAAISTMSVRSLAISSHLSQQVSQCSRLGRCSVKQNKNGPFRLNGPF